MVISVSIPTRRTSATGQAPLLLLPEAQRESHTRAEIEWQRWITDGSDVLVAGEIVELGVDAHPRLDLVSRAQIDPGPGIIEIAIGKEQGVASVDVVASEEC